MTIQQILQQLKKAADIERAADKEALQAAQAAVSGVDFDSNLRSSMIHAGTRIGIEYAINTICENMDLSNPFDEAAPPAKSIQPSAVLETLENVFWGASTYEHSDDTFHYFKTNRHTPDYSVTHWHRVNKQTGDYGFSATTKPGRLDASDDWFEDDDGVCKEMRKLVEKA